MKALIISTLLFFATLASAADTVTNRTWVELVPGNPSIWVDTQNMTQEKGVLHVAIKTKFGTPQKFSGYVEPDGLTRLPMYDITSYIISDTYINCDGSTYRVFSERFFNISDEQFFGFTSRLKTPTTIDTDSPPEIAMKKYCKAEN